MSNLSQKNTSKTPMIVKQIVLVFIVFAVAVFVTYRLKVSRKPQHKKIPKAVAPLVEVIKVKPQTVNILINGYGQVQPTHEAQIVAQISGEILSLSINDGDFFKKDQDLVVIDPRDYELALESAKAKIAAAKVKLELEKAEALVAKQEWQELNPDKKPSSDLVFRVPQIKNAQANLLSGESMVAKAKLDLERTRISAPFDGRVVKKFVDLGQYVARGTPLARVYSSDSLEVDVPLENSKLAWIKAGPDGSNVVVHTKFAGKDSSWSGRLVRTAGKIDSMTRMVHVFVEVDNPFEVVDGNAMLTPGMFVEVDIQGAPLKNAFVLPRRAVRGRDSVWVVKDGKLDIRKVVVAMSNKDVSYITDGLDDSDVVVTSTIEAAVNGMNLRCELESTDTTSGAIK